MFAAGCYTKPTPMDRSIVTTEPTIASIVFRYERIISDLRNSDIEAWHHNWTGNIIPNTLGGRHKGLCFEWQERVWAEITPTLKRVGWKGVGLAANRDHWTEHHVIVVYDPARVRASELLLPPLAANSDGWIPKAGAKAAREDPKAPAWVLDPWHTGTPAVYSLPEWLTHGTAEWFDVSLEGLGGLTLPQTTGE